MSTCKKIGNYVVDGESFPFQIVNSKTYKGIKAKYSQREQLSSESSQAIEGEVAKQRLKDEKLSMKPARSEPFLTPIIVYTLYFNNFDKHVEGEEKCLDYLLSSMVVAKKIHFCSFFATGRFLGDFAKLTNITALSILLHPKGEHDGISSGIDLQMTICSLGSMVNLERLKIVLHKEYKVWEKVSYFPIGKLVNLKKFSIVACDRDVGVIQYVKDLPLLESLRVVLYESYRDEKISAGKLYEYIGDMQGLVSLTLDIEDIKYWQIEDFRFLKKLTKLKYLRFVNGANMFFRPHEYPDLPTFNDIQLAVFIALHVRGLEHLIIDGASSSHIFEAFQHFRESFSFSDHSINTHAHFSNLKYIVCEY